MGKKTKSDPTGQKSNRKRAENPIRQRLASARRQVRKIFSNVPRRHTVQKAVVNQDREIIYEYDIDSSGIENIERQVRRAIDDELVETLSDEMPIDWYGKSSIEVPYRQGTLEETRDFSGLIAAGIAAGFISRSPTGVGIDPPGLIFSPGYNNSLRNMQVRFFGHIKSLSSKVSSQVIDRITKGIRSGQSPAFIVNEISERFEVGMSSAKMIAETSVNEAYNNAKIDAARILGHQTGLKPGVVHVSALLPTTRASHAARHGNAYTLEAQNQWWDEGSNRINCKCTTKTVLIDDSGNVVQSELQDEIKSDRSFFDEH